MGAFDLDIAPNILGVYKRSSSGAHVLLQKAIPKYAYLWLQTVTTTFYNLSKQHIATIRYGSKSFFGEKNLRKKFKF